MTEWCPCRAAQWSGLDPLLSVTLTLQVFLSDRWATVDEWPFHEAQCSGVQPYCEEKQIINTVLNNLVILPCLQH